MSAASPHPAESTSAEYKVRVLLVDDQLIIVEAVRRMLASHPDIEYHYVTDPHAALASAQALRPTVILQDLVMPGVDGFDLIQEYRADAVLREVPVIVLTTKDEPKLKAHGFAVGANDYLVKLPDQLELVARIRHHSSGYIKGLKCEACQAKLTGVQAELAQVKAELAALRGA
ncbi:MAG: response regulator [Oxalobacteraceae bacterium]|nr:MAG: response regulator [Oxalobacteraceae bacterium]